ncbi:MAG TPA: ATP-binding protein [Chthonomonadales bacterium]|nr:ATP-binding protein [Chthonomonadales bacterium]
MRNLRTQLLASHVALLFLMLLVMGGATVSFRRLGTSIDRILRDNYQSVKAAQDMKDALERIDSAAALVLAGENDRARSQYVDHRARFEGAYQVAANNITEPGEREIADDIGRRFADYRAKVESLLHARPPVALAEARQRYLRVLEPAFADLKRRCQDVLDLNQTAIVRADLVARDEAFRASWMGMGATVGVLVLAVPFVLSAVGGALAPLRSLALHAEEIGRGHLHQRIEVDRTDEVGVLASSFNRMSRKLLEARRAEEERLRRAERMSDAAIDSLYDPVLVTDARGNVVHLNRAAEGLFGLAQEAAGQPVEAVVAETRIVEAVARAIHQRRVSAAEDQEAIFELQAGALAHAYRLRATPMHDEDGSLLGSVVVLEDMTNLRQLDRLKGEFIAVASHELRTPVTSLLLSVQALEEGAAGSLSDVQRDVVAAQKEDLQRLERLMRDLLDVSRLEAGVTPPRFEPVCAGDLVDASVASVAGEAQAGGVRLERHVEEGLGPGWADRGQMVRVLTNLLSNGIRHTPSGGAVTIDCRRDEGHLVLRVSDTGEGIPPDYVPRIFERFVQVPGATRGGAGLGLSIAQTIVRAHRGRIDVQSELGRGSVFTVRLPWGDERGQVT